MTTANKITMLRVVLVAVFVIVLLSGIPYAEYYGLAVFIIASISDCIDGHIARKYNQITDFGKLMDPLADKVLVMAAMLIFVEWGQMPSWCLLIVITREFAVTMLRMIAVSKGVTIAAGKSGKFKTASTMVGICFMLTPIKDFYLIPKYLTVNTFFIVVIVITTLYSGIEYFWKNRKFITTM